MIPARRGKWLALAAWGAGMWTVATAAQWEQPSGKWEKLADCRYVPNAADDGDSFYVRHGGDTFLFRLYAVDTPETMMTYADRVEAQARHFGITPAQAIKAGLEAERFTRRLLLGSSFTVETCWQDAKGNSPVPRYYAVITANGKDLAGELAAAGLARVFGFTPPLPGFSLPKLEVLERLARLGHLGAYAFAKGTPSSQPPSTASNPSAAPAGGKIDVNTATEAQLVAVPGIGPHYARELIAGRPYENLDAIIRVKGIGPKTLAKLAPYLSVAGD
ncbi:MAG: helix-hairpin-helix domain-containing protein [Terrimicrobiaceae bacterium]|nr:helix-hairpin-helix domain-containing protein [Terrimicrobiaceae bacterium]